MNILKNIASGANAPAIRLMTTLVFSLVWTARVSAQSPVDAAAQTAERVQREQQDRQREEFRRASQAHQPPTSIEVPLPATHVPVSSEIKREIHTLIISGADHMRAEFHDRLRTEYTGSLGVSDVQALLSAITRHYVLRGYATTRAYLPEQDLSTGVLQVVVVEGRIERFEGVGVSGNIFPAERGELLDLRKIEQGLDNLNRLASNDAKLELLPGTTAGDSIVAIRNTPGRRWHLSSSLDNSGSEDTGRNQASLTFSLDNALGWADYLSVTHRRAVPYHSDREASQSTTASYTVPWGWNALTVGGSISSYALTYYAPSGTALPFDGDSDSVFISADRLLWRDRAAQLKGQAKLNYRSSRNYILGSLIGVSSRATTTLDLNLNYSRALWGGSFFSQGGLVLGVPWFGGLEDGDNLPDYAARAQYAKVVFNLSYSRAFNVSKRRILISSSLNGQWVDRVLYGTDQLTGGGQYAVRGFDENNPSGDWGVVWRNDVSMPFRVESLFGSNLGVRPYLGADVGRLWSNVDGLPERFVPPEGGLLGGALGVALSWRTANLDLSYHQSFDRPGGVPDEDGRFYARASFRY